MRFKRLSIRKLVIYSLAVSSCILLALNIHQMTLGLFTNDIHTGFQTGLRKYASSFTGPSAPGPFANQDPAVRKSAQEKPVAVIPPIEQRPWYMVDGKVWPTQKISHLDDKILPNELQGSDRISVQLMHLPPKGVLPENQYSADVPLKKILLWNGIQSWGGLRAGRGVFLKEKCPVSTCAISSSRLDSQKADLVLFKDHFTTPSFSRPTDQLWMIYMLECPLHTHMFRDKNLFNWTATYRSDSTVVAPYERWQYYNEDIKQLPAPKNYAANKTKTVAWFVSNCGGRNGRLKYAKELAKHIQVDIYGACGTKSCPRTKANDCFKMLSREYKFYLAFENSNCIDYITEKFFVNGLGNDLIPIVMGARPEDYERAAPYKSYIHVDDFNSPKELAAFLHKLDGDDDLYNEYFKWKGTGEMINTKFFCRVCELLHEPKVLKQRFHYEDFNDWWGGKGTCINGNWRKYQGAKLREEQLKKAQGDVKDIKNIDKPESS